MNARFRNEAGRSQWEEEFEKQWRAPVYRRLYSHAFHSMILINAASSTSGFIYK